MNVDRVAVVGAGAMGSGIAHVCALAGLQVALFDADPDAANRAKRTIARNLDRQASKGRISPEQREDALERVAATRSLDDAAAQADVVIEAVSERPEVKHALFEALDRLAPEHALLASNTSSISITGIAACTGRPEKVAGMHFMNPVPVMRLVEVVRGMATSEATARAVVDLSRALGKTPVEVRDFPGFVSNRILAPMLNEAVFALMEGVADARAIDQVMTLGMNHPMGPLALADLIGLDVVLHILEVLHRDLGDDRYRPCPLLRQYVAAGWLGRKSGRGFHRYDDAGPTRATGTPAPC